MDSYLYEPKQKIMEAKTKGLLLHFFIFVVLPLPAHSAGYCDSRDSSLDAQRLNLNPGENFRHGPPPPPGLTTHKLEADVIVAGGSLIADKLLFITMNTGVIPT